jgi:hypothetical protein
MRLLQYGLTKTINLSDTNPIFEPNCTMLIFRKVRASTFRYQIFDLLNFDITDLTFTCFLF